MYSKKFKQYKRADSCLNCFVGINYLLQHLLIPDSNINGTRSLIINPKLWYQLYIVRNKLAFDSNEGLTRPKSYIEERENKKINKFFEMSENIYYHCNRCCDAAGNSCLLHKQQIEIFYGFEIDKLDKRRRYECNSCFKIGFSNGELITCRFCSSRNIKLI